MIIDCITFYNENILANARFEILNDVVDQFIVCESGYDHSGKQKNKNFKLLNKSFESKIKYIFIEKNFPLPIKPWKNEEIQRNYIQKELESYSDEDLILYSDSDEIPNPKLLKSMKLNKKYGIFFQKNYVFKINLFNKYETPWEGTRICKKKDLKTINKLRKKILSKNLKKSFWKFYIEKDIEIYEDGGWHFNNLYNLETISEKLKAFPHKEFSSPKFTDHSVIKEKILKNQDLFERGHVYEKVELDDTYPEYIIKNKDKFKDYIL